MLACPICDNEHPQPYAEDKRRKYYQCPDCHLVFVGKAFLLDANQEFAEYQLHENNVDDAGYQRFLTRVSEPLVLKLKQRTESGLNGLDFGCGPGPALAKMLTLQGYPTALYDPFFFDDKQVLTRTYDFITCTEAIEHFHKPGEEWSKLMKLLKPHGWLAIMTKRVLGKDKFQQWHYKNDPTHVCFFSEDTFNFLADTSGLSVEYPSADVVLFHKP